MRMPRRVLDLLAIAVVSSVAAPIALRLCGAVAAAVTVNAADAPAHQITAAPSAAAALEQARQLQMDADRQVGAGQLAEAAAKTEQALAIRRPLLGDMHPDVAYSIHRRGIIAFSQGRYDDAEAGVSEALTIRRATLGPNHPDVAQSLNDLASILQRRGDYVRPEPMYQEALRIYQQTLAQQSLAAGSPPRAAELQSQIGDLLSNLGRLYYVRGDYTRSESQYLKARAIRELRGPDDPGVAQTLANVGAVYYSSGQYDKALRVFRRALDIQQQRLPATHPALAIANFGLAGVYFNQGHFADAQALFEKALAIDEAAFGPRHSRVATRLVGLAEVLRLQGAYTRAEPLYERAQAIQEESLGSAHPDVATTMVARSLLHYASGDLDAAAEQMLRGAELREQTLGLVLTTGSEEQKRLYLRTLADETDIAVSLHLGARAAAPAAARLALTTILQRKGRTIDTMADQIASLRRHLNDTDRDVLDQLSQARSRLATMALRGVSTEAQTQSVASLRTRHRTVRTAHQRPQCGVPDHLPHGDARIGPAGAARRRGAGGVLPVPAVCRPQHPREYAFGAPHYAAYVVRSGGITGSVDLGDAAAVDRDVRRFRAALSNPADNSVRRAGRTLHQRLIAPLESALDGVERLIVSPDGALNLIPFSALVEPPDTFLLERFTLSYVTSGRDLTRLRETGASPLDARAPPVIVANPSFSQARRPGAAPDTTGATRAIGALAFEQTARFTPLPGTGLEAAALAAMLPGARLYTGADATEALVKTVTGPSVLHVATHGFFLAPRTRGSTAAGGYSIALHPGGAAERDEALVRSGLVLAGANQRFERQRRRRSAHGARGDRPRPVGHPAGGPVGLRDRRRRREERRRRLRAQAGARPGWIGEPGDEPVAGAGCRDPRPDDRLLSPPSGT